MEERRIIVEKEYKEIKDKGIELQRVLFVIQRRISSFGYRKGCFVLFRNLEARKNYFEEGKCTFKCTFSLLWVSYNSFVVR